MGSDYSHAHVGGSSRPDTSCGGGASQGTSVGALGLEEDEEPTSSEEEGEQEGHDEKGPDDFVDKEANQYQKSYGRRLSVFQV